MTTKKALIRDIWAGNDLYSIWKIEMQYDQIKNPCFSMENLIDDNPIQTTHRRQLHVSESRNHPRTLESDHRIKWPNGIKRNSRLHAQQGITHWYLEISTTELEIEDRTMIRTRKAQWSLPSKPFPWITLRLTWEGFPFSFCNPISLFLLRLLFGRNPYRCNWEAIRVQQET